jgi:hypothetical protein
MNTPSETRKADRQKMAALVIEQATRLGCKAYIEEALKDNPYVVWARIEAPGGLLLTVEFDGKSWQPNTHVLSWHMTFDSTRRLSPDYWPHLNTVHHHKATDVAHGFEALTALLERRLADAVAGTVYQPEACA